MKKFETFLTENKSKNIFDIIKNFDKYPIESSLTKYMIINYDIKSEEEFVKLIKESGISNYWKNRLENTYVSHFYDFKKIPLLF